MIVIFLVQIARNASYVIVEVHLFGIYEQWVIWYSYCYSASQVLMLKMSLCVLVYIQLTKKFADNLWNQFILKNIEIRGILKSTVITYYYLSINLHNVV